MEITNLPPELQFEYLLKLTPEEILNYCQTNKTAQSICDDPHFWDRKSKIDFLVPASLLCNMTPYWKYRYIQMLSGTPALLLGPVLRSGDQEMIDLFLAKLTLEDISISLEVAIQEDDLTILQHLAPIFFRQKFTEYGKYLEYALIYDSVESVRYLVSLNPKYINDLVNLDELLEVTPPENLSHTLLVEHLKEIVRVYGKNQVFILAEDEDLPQILNLLKMNE